MDGRRHWGGVGPPRLGGDIGVGMGAWRQWDGDGLRRGGVVGHNTDLLHHSHHACVYIYMQSHLKMTTDVSRVIDDTDFV